MIGLVTDSASMLPSPWAERFDVAVVPMIVVLDGAPLREGVDIDSSTFYRQVAVGVTVSTSAPAPGEVLATFRSLVDRGATRIVSVHTGSDYSAVVSSARIAAQDLDVPVEIVDTGTVSFPVALCVAAAARARAEGAHAEVVAEVARRTASTIDSLFIVGTPDLAVRSGRLPVEVGTPTPSSILRLCPDGLSEHATADSIERALVAIAEHVGSIAERSSLLVGVGDADRPDLGSHLADLVAGWPGVAELVRYEIGPSVGTHSGPGTVGAVWSTMQETPGER